MEHTSREETDDVGGKNIYLEEGRHGEGKSDIVLDLEHIWRSCSFKKVFSLI